MDASDNDLYALLDVAADAWVLRRRPYRKYADLVVLPSSSQQLRKAYRQKSLKVHPDRVSEMLFRSCRTEADCVDFDDCSTNILIAS